MRSFEPTRDELSGWLGDTAEKVVDFVESLTTARAKAPITDPELFALLQEPPASEPGEFKVLLDVMLAACTASMETAGPGNLALVPGGGLPVVATADMLAAATNRLTSLGANGQGLVALEDGVMRWLCELFGLPAEAVGVATTGGSLSTLSAVVAAREWHLGDDLRAGVVYHGAAGHPCVGKAARIAGLAAPRIRCVPSTPDQRIDLRAAGRMIEQDTAEKRRPFLLSVTAGTTDTGAVDDLDQAADLAREHGLWLHVDAAYGGFFQLTRRGRALLRGIERADSIALNAHKSLFLPYGTGILLVRDRSALRAAFGCQAHCLRDTQGADTLPDYADLGPELTREARGLRLWLPLHLYGTDAFASTLDEKLDLAEYAYNRLSADPRLHLPWQPTLATVAFAVHGHDDHAHEALLRRINASGRVALSSTRIDGRVVLRMCLLNHRTHHDTVEEAVDLIMACLTPDAPADDPALFPTPLRQGAS